MGFEELAHELEKHSEAEGRKMVGAAEKAAEKTVEAANEKAAESLRAAKKEASEFAEQESAERLTSAKLEAKKIVDEAKNDAVEEALAQVWEQFKSDSLKKPSYSDLFSRLLTSGMAELGRSEAVAYVRDEDRQLASGMKLARLPPEYAGGLILESVDGKVRVNKTLEEEFVRKREALRKEIYARLF